MASSSTAFSDDMIIHYDFTRDNWDKSSDNISSFEGWRSKISSVTSRGKDLEATEGQNFDFIYANLPSEADFFSPDKTGQIDAVSTQWNSVTCPSPEYNLMILGQDETLGAKFSMAILVDQTE